MSQQFSPERCIKNLSDAVQIKTVSSPDGKNQDYAPFDHFILFLSKAYPLCHRQLEHTRINNYGLVYRLKGKNRDADPLLFLSHYDILQPAPEYEHLWSYSPFEGTVCDGFIHGRGILRSKAALIALFETIERLLESGQQPERDVYLAVGFDSLSGGNLGTSRIVSFFKSQKLHFDCILDVGGCCINGLLPQLQRNVALIGVGSKGCADLKITLNKPCGSTVIPKEENALTALAQILVDIQNNPMPAHLTPPIKTLLKRIAPDLGGSRRRLFDHIDLFKPSLLKHLSKSPLTNALIRTIVVSSMFSGSPSSGIFPYQSNAILKCHLLPGDRIDDVIQHIRRLAPKEALSFDVLNLHEPSPIFSDETTAFRQLEACASVVFPNLQTAPSLCLVAGDLQKYSTLSNQIYQFTPICLTLEDLESISGINEKISFDNLLNAVTFYTMFILNYQ